MADFTMGFTIPDDKVADLVKAVDHLDPLPKDEDGNAVARTPAQAKAWFEAKFRGSMRTVYKEYKRWEAAQAQAGADLGDT